MKKSFLSLAFISLLFFNNVFSQSDTIQSRNQLSNQNEDLFIPVPSSDLHPSRSFILGAGYGPVGSYSGFMSFDFGVQFRLMKRLYIYPNLKFLAGSFVPGVKFNDEYINQATILTLPGAAIKYYFFEFKRSSLYLSAGLSANSIMKDENDIYQIEKDGLVKEFLFGWEISLTPKLRKGAISFDTGYAIIPTTVDNSDYLYHYYGPPLMDNVKINLGGIVLVNARFIF